MNSGRASRELVASIVRGICATTVLDAMDFQNVVVPIHDAGESILADSKFREGSAGEWFEEIVRVSPLRIDDLVQFRDDAILNVRVEGFELVECRRRELPVPVVFTLRHRNPSHRRLRRG